MAAMKVQGGGMVPATGEDARRKAWLKNREYRLQEALRNGEVELALGWVSDIQGSAKPGDVNPTRLEAVQNALRKAKSEIAMAQSAAQKIVSA